MAVEMRIPIIATPRSDGQGKTKNSTPEQVHRTDVINYEDAFFYIYIAMTACIHGVWDEMNHDMTPTTFLLFDCEVQSLRKFRAKKIRLEINFGNVDDLGGKRPRANPSIVSRGPEVIRRFHQVPVLRKREVGLQGSIEAGHLIKPGIAIHRISTQEYEKQYFAEARSGIRHASPTDHRYVKVWWIYTENKKGAEGVAPGFRIAVLLKRENDSPFQGQVAITQFDAGWSFAGARALHNFWSERGSSDVEEDKIIDPINFDPTVQDQVRPAWMVGVDEKNLGALQTSAGIDKEYARIWGVDL
ncbi:hypothetical protein GGS20DRAFT_531645 [Poronia punctata]|nr:hypothetical protein GGS20DRAFT_531645 [Poronia punctata]